MEKLIFLALAVIVNFSLSESLAYQVATLWDGHHDGDHQLSYISRTLHDNERGRYFLATSTSKNNIIKVYMDGNVSVEVLAGSAEGESGFKDGSLREARFNKPMGIDVDALGNLVIADSLNHAIRFIDVASKQVHTIVGNGKPGRTNGPGLVSQLSNPTDVAITGEYGCAILATDTGNSAVRIITRSSSSRTAKKNDCNALPNNARGLHDHISRWTLLLILIGALIIGFVVGEVVALKLGPTISKLPQLLLRRPPANLSLVAHSTALLLLAIAAHLFVHPLIHTMCQIISLAIALKSYALRPLSSWRTPPVENQHQCSPRAQGATTQTSRSDSFARTNGPAKDGSAPRGMHSAKDFPDLINWNWPGENLPLTDGKLGCGTTKMPGPLAVPSLLDTMMMGDRTFEAKGEECMSCDSVRLTGAQEPLPHGSPAGGRQEMKGGGGAALPRAVTHLLDQ